MLWGPGVIGIAVALAIAAVIGSARVPLSAAMNLGLAFEVVSNYGIAAAEFLDPAGLNPQIRWFGLSWVAVWTLLFTVVIPTPPGRAVMAALASVSSVPVVVWFEITVYPIAFKPSPFQFFLALVFPYLLVVVMAYVGARVVYALGTEVSRARELGSYRLVERLGEGGMGEVWSARHRMLARPAAVKLIRTSASSDARSGVSEDAQRRFEREAQAIARLRSPHTIELFDFGVADDGTFYYVMELLDGLNADELVRRTGPVPAERAIHILRQICHSLSEAESCGLVHRDIKPANIFLCRYGEDYDFVKVLDFGIVKPTGIPQRPASLSRSTTSSMGHLPSSLPSRRWVDRLSTDGPTSTPPGCVAYWLLTGELVFTADTAFGLVMHHAHTAPTPPSARTELSIPAALDQLVLWCLEKDPRDRPQTAKELSRRLAAVDGANAWTEERARDWWARYQPVPVSGRLAAR